MLQLARSIFSRQSLNKAQIDQWDREGYLALRSFFEPGQIQRFEHEVRDIIDHRQTRAGDVTVDLVAGPLMGQRLRLADVPADALDHPHKINDLYLQSQACRDLALNEALCQILGSLLGGRPMVINSLTFAKGSQQPHHFDTYYMPPPVQGRMVASSICIEDQSELTGPLSYYPGSHRIPPYRFSHGGIHTVEAEMKDATAYIEEQIEKLGLERQTFIGQTGDVFIWHGQLYHGGMLIKDYDRSRKTLVTHYWRTRDVARKRVRKVGAFGSYLIKDGQPGK